MSWSGISSRAPQGSWWPRDQPGPGSSPDLAKHRLPCRYPTSGSISSHPRCMFRWREHEALHCAPGKPQDSEISVSARGHVLHTVPATWYQFPAGFFFFNLINLFLAALGLHCCLSAFSHCRGGWTYYRGQALGHVGSIVVAHGLNCSEAWGIFQDQGLNLCLLHRQVASLPRDHQGSPACCLFYKWLCWQGD